MNTRKKTNFIILLCGFCIYLCAFGEQVTFDININNQLCDKILVSLAPIEDFSKLAGSFGNIIGEPLNEKQLFPSLSLEEVTKNSIFNRSQKDSLELLPLKRTKFFAILDKVDFKKMNIYENPFIVQRLVVKNSKNNEIIGYISFRCSIYNTNPIITIEAAENYTIFEERIPFGGGISFIISQQVQ